MQSRGAVTVLLVFTLAYGVYNDTGLADFASYLNGAQGSTVIILYYHQISDKNDFTAVTQASFQVQM